MRRRNDRGRRGLKEKREKGRLTIAFFLQDFHNLVSCDGELVGALAWKCVKRFVCVFLRA